MNQIEIANSIQYGDATTILSNLPSESINLVYLDPPFYSQKIHSLKTRDLSKSYSFDDRYNSLNDYLLMIKSCLLEIKRILKKDGSVFLHCDRYASHHLRILLDEVFGDDNFQSEIIWTYKRWSNSKKGLLNAHQNIYFYAKTKDFKFNHFYSNYSPSTNIDQILQERERDNDGKSVYKKKNGEIILSKNKKGVPISDVWEIPYLNPKAKERCGYPTQKPVVLLQKIIKLVTNENDFVLDPFCGSGTTCVAAKSLNRNYIGIDNNREAIELSKKRIENMVISESAVLKRGLDSFIEKSSFEIGILSLLHAIPVQRNKGIDGFIQDEEGHNLIPIKIQKENETLDEAISSLENAVKNKGFSCKILIQTNDLISNSLFQNSTDVKVVKYVNLQVNSILKNIV